MKDEFKLELQSSETMELFGGTKINRQKKLLYTFNFNKSHAYLLNVEQMNKVVQCF